MSNIELPLTKAKLIPSKGQAIDVLFNPDEYTLERSVNYASHVVPGLDIPIAQFVNGQADTLSMSLFFDTMAAPEGGSGDVQKKLQSTSKQNEDSKQDVRTYTQKVYGMMAVNSDLHAPPLVTFEWGSLKFEGYIVSVNQRFTKFTHTGIPVRATLDVQFQAAKAADAQLRGAPRNSPDRTKYRVVHEGEQLYDLSSREYGSAGKWREIAAANDIENPRRLQTGRTLRIPALLRDIPE